VKSRQAGGMLEAWSLAVNAGAAACSAEVPMRRWGSRYRPTEVQPVSTATRRAAGRPPGSRRHQRTFG